MRISQIEPWIDSEELRELEKVVHSTFVTEGKATAEFECRIKALTGAGHAVAMANGTVALFCALRALGVGPGDEVIVPDLTFVATANAVILAGARPVFADVRADTYCIDVDAVDRLVTSRTRSVVPVHLYGLAAEMDQLKQLCESKDLMIVEDAAQGVGVRFKGRHVGTFGQAGMLSFYGNKTITTGEGGVVVTDDDTIAQNCYRLKNHGRSVKGVFVHETVGYNFSFTDLQAAVGLAQMNKLERIIARKRQIRDFYAEALEGVGDIQMQLVPSHTEPVFWFTNISTSQPEALSEHLGANGVGSRRFFYPLHMQPCYRDLDPKECPASRDAYFRSLSLPSGVGLSDDDLGFVAECIADFFAS